MYLRRQLISIADRMLITLADAKTHLSEFGSTRDGDITAAILAGYNHVSTHTSRAILAERWRLYHDRWETIRIPRGQLQSVESVKYLDEDGAEQTVSADDYVVIGIGGDEGYIAFADSFDYPALYDHEPVRVEFTAGWEAEAVPEEIVWALKLYIEKLINDDDTDETVDNLLTPYRLEWF